LAHFLRYREGVPRYREKLSRLAEHTHTHTLVGRAGVCRLRVEEATLGEPQRYRRGLRDVLGDTWGGEGGILEILEGG